MTSFSRSVLRAITRLRLEEIRDAANFAERSIEREARKWEERIERLERDDDEVDRETLEAALELHSRFSGHPKASYAYHLRGALLLTAYAGFENEMNKVADHLRETDGVRLKLTDLRHRGVKRVQVYFTKVLERPFPDTRDVWREVLGLNELRKAVAHRGRRLRERESGGDPNAWRLVDAWDSIEVWTMYMGGSKSQANLTFRSGFLSDVTDTLERFWERLFKGLRQDPQR